MSASPETTLENMELPAVEPEPFNVVTWNVLSGALCNSKQYPPNMFASAHINRLCRNKMIKIAIDQILATPRTVLLLQEVDSALASELAIEHRNAWCKITRYGTLFNGYMCLVTLATANLTPVASSEHRIADRLPTPDPGWRRRLTSPFQPLANLLPSWLCGAVSQLWKPTPEMVAKRRWNFAQATVFELSADAKQRATVVNYHSPCTLDRQPWGDTTHGVVTRRIHLRALADWAGTLKCQHGGIAVIGLDSNLVRSEIAGLHTQFTIRSNMLVTCSTRSARTPDGFRAEIDYVLTCEDAQAEHLSAEELSSMGIGFAAKFCADDRAAGRTGSVIVHDSAGEADSAGSESEDGDDEFPYFPNETNPSDHIPVAMRIQVRASSGELNSQDLE